MFMQAFKDFLARYIAVWRDVWLIRDQLNPPKRSAEELAFLPAHLELTDTPISVLPKWIVRFIVVFTIFSLMWSWFGQIDIVATASGNILSSDRSKTIQPLETSVVKEIYVHNGQHVRKGEVLVDLTAIGSDSDIIQFERDLHLAELSKLRQEAMLVSLNKHNTPKIDVAHAKALGLLESDIQAAQLLALNQYQSWMSQDEQLKSALRGHQAELDAAYAQEQKLISIGVIENRKTKDYYELRADDFISEHAYLEQESKSIANKNDLQSTRSQIQRLNALIKQAEKNRELNTQNLRRDILDSLRQIGEQIDHYNNQVYKAKQRQKLLSIQSPVDGVVQELSTYTVGGVVQAAQKIMVVVPNDENMEVEALVLNKDIGFVKVGQNVIIKVESFPYTRYGFLTGKVKSISLDATTHHQLGLVYAATISLDKNTLDIGEKEIHLTSGMNVTVEIKTGKRRVLDYMLSPLQVKLDESFRER